MKKLIGTIMSMLFFMILIFDFKPVKSLANELVTEIKTMSGIIRIPSSIIEKEIDKCNQKSLINLDLRFACFDLKMANNNQGTICRYNFESSLLNYAEFKFVKIKDSSFRNASLHGTDFGKQVDIINCDFTDAKIHRIVPGPSTGNPTQSSRFCNSTDEPSAVSFFKTPASNIRQTKSFKEKNLSGVVIQTWQGDDFILDYSAFKLHGSQLPELSPECKFNDAEIRSAKLSGMTKMQLYSTSDYKNGILQNITFDNSDFSNIDFASINLTNCKFIPINPQSKNSGTNFKDANFNGSIISNCDFTSAKNLTISQINSTWNYKNNRMEGIRLPAEIQKALELDKEKQNVKN
jgi:uncharacterized protein YjbI with pentapeptide repeats